MQEVRFTKADDFWLSHSYKTDSLWIGFYNYEYENWAETMPFHEEFVKQFDGRPHWGKEFTINKHYLKKQYKRFDDFIELNDEFDSGRKFENGFIAKVFEQDSNN